MNWVSDATLVRMASILGRVVVFVSLLIVLAGSAGVILTSTGRLSTPFEIAVRLAGCVALSAMGLWAGLYLQRWRPASSTSPGGVRDAE